MEPEQPIQETEVIEINTDIDTETQKFEEKAKEFNSKYNYPFEEIKQMTLGNMKIVINKTEKKINMIVGDKTTELTKESCEQFSEFFKILANEVNI